MRRQVAAIAAALATVLAGCTTGGSSGSAPSSSEATRATSDQASASSTPAVSVAPGAAVKTTASDVAGFDVSAHALRKTSDTSPDRSRISSSTLPDGFTTPPPGKGRQRYLDQKITWKACGSYQCGTVLVPLDWDHPDGQAITLRMKKAPAAKQHTATLFVNPGGPGGSGQDLVDSMNPSDFPGHDVIGWDPRGSGESTPVHCGTNAQIDQLLAVDQSPDDAAEWTADIDASRTLAKQCRDNSGVLLDHVSTIDNVRDLDYLRHLVGDKKLDYLGISYGTFIGATYAELYPARTGRMILDSAVNITDDDSVVQSMGFDLALKNFATWCAENRCGLGDTQDAVVKSVTGFFDQLDGKPLTVNGRTMTQSLGVAGTMTFLYMGEQGYRGFATALQRALQGDGGMILAAADLMNGRDARGNYSSQFAAFPAIACADSTDSGIAGAKAELAADEKKAPILAKYFGADLSCPVWSARPAAQLHITAKGAAPIVVLGVTGDPATPYQQAQGMAKQLSSGVLVTWKGAGHSAWELGNSCVKDAVKGYVNDGTVPKNGLVC